MGSAEKGRLKWSLYSCLVTHLSGFCVAWNDQAYFYSALEGMLVHHHVTERYCILSTQCPRPWPEPGQLDLDSSVLIIRPPASQQQKKKKKKRTTTRRYGKLHQLLEILWEKLNKEYIVVNLTFLYVMKMS